jgi:hypothetical protein
MSAGEAAVGKLPAIKRDRRTEMERCSSTTDYTDFTDVFQRGDDRLLAARSAD